jgi:hypothetical protein
LESNRSQDPDQGGKLEKIMHTSCNTITHRHNSHIQETQAQFHNSTPPSSLATVNNTLKSPILVAASCNSQPVIQLFTPPSLTTQ